MIVHEDEALRLHQLTDRDHRLEMTRVGGSRSMPSTPGNAWARTELLDWRARHPLSCPCWKTVGRA
jgi:hypothetical protein